MRIKEIRPFTVEEIIAKDIYENKNPPPLTQAGVGDPGGGRVNRWDWGAGGGSGSNARKCVRYPGSGGYPLQKGSSGSQREDGGGHGQGHGLRACGHYHRGGGSGKGDRADLPGRRKSGCVNTGRLPEYF